MSCVRTPALAVVLAPALTLAACGGNGDAVTSPFSAGLDASDSVDRQRCG